MSLRVQQGQQRQLQASTTDGDSSEESEQKHPPEKYAMPHDMWGEMVMSIIDMWDRETVYKKWEKESKHMDLFGFMAFIIWLLTVGVVFGLTYMLYATFIEDGEDPFEVGLPGRTEELLNATAAKDPGLLSTRTAALCEGQKVRYLAAYIVSLALFSMKALSEVMGAFGFLTVVLRMSDHEELEDDDRPLEKQYINKRDGVDGHSPDKHDIIALPCCLKWLILCVGPVPRVLLSSWVWWMGLKFLIFASTTAAIVLKSMACGWFFMIDEMFFNAFIAKGRREKLEHTSFLFPYNAAIDKDTNCAQIGRVLFRLIVIIGVALFTQYVIYSELTEFRTACQAYYHEVQLPEILKAAPNTGLTSVFV